MIQYIRNFQGGFLKVHGYDMEKRVWRDFIVSVMMRTTIGKTITKVQVLDVLGGKYILQPRGCDICYQLDVGDVMASDRGFRYSSTPGEAPGVPKTWAYDGPSPIIGYPKTTAMEFDNKGSCKVLPMGS